MDGLRRWCRESKRGYVLVLAGTVLGAGVAQGSAQQRYLVGQEVVPSYEGWEHNADGSFNLLFGTMNRNWGEELDIPIGPANNIEPGGPDQGQPTHFLPRRNRFLFRVRVPVDFGDREIVWTLTSPNGETKTAYATLHPDYFIDDLVLQRNNGAPAANELLINKAPVLEVEGETSREVDVGRPLNLTVSFSDDGLLTPTGLPPTDPARPGRVTKNAARGLRLAWFVYRGAGDVTFDPEQFRVWEDTREGSNSPWAPGWKVPSPPADGKWVTLATFSEPGTYVLRCLAHDGGLTTHKDITFVVR
jgi:hypothetical protein